MTAAFVVAPAAEQDIIEIGAHIEADDHRAARKLVTEIYDCFPQRDRINGLEQASREKTFPLFRSLL